MIRADLVLADPNAGPFGQETRQPAVPVSTRNKGTRLSAKVCLAAIDLALRRGNIDFLKAWRSGDTDAIGAVNSTLTRRRKGEAGSEGSGAQ